MISKLKELYGNFVNAEVHVQADLNEIIPLPDILPLYTKKIDLNDSEQVNAWVEVVNEAYADANYDFESAQKLLTRHHFLVDTETFLIFDKNKVIATVSCGIYPDFPDVGGVFRLAVRKDYQGRGVGKYIILYGYHHLKNIGIKKGESVISAHRTVSIITHIKCGLKPQYDPKKVYHKRSYFNRNYIQRKRAVRALKKAENFLLSKKV